MRVLLVALFVFSIALPCAAQTFTVSPVTNCPFYTEAVNISLFAGTYHIEWVSGATSAFPDDTYQGGYVWQSQVQAYVYSTAQTFTIGSPPLPGLYTSYELAEAAALGIATFVVPSNSVVGFYIYEAGFTIGQCADNRGSVTLKFVEPLATQPATWGAIKALYR